MRLGRVGAGDLARCGGARGCVDDCAGGVVDASGGILGDSLSWGCVGGVVGMIAAAASIVAAIGAGGGVDVGFAVGRWGDVIV